LANSRKHIHKKKKNFLSSLSEQHTLQLLSLSLTTIAATLFHFITVIAAVFYHNHHHRR
jgi:hypothetical protein